MLSAIQFQAQEYIPIPVDEVVLDSQIIGRRIGPDGSARQQVLLVAAQKTMIMNLLSAVRKAGLKVLGVDVASLALLRALVPEGSFLPDTDAGAVMSWSRGHLFLGLHAGYRRERGSQVHPHHQLLQRPLCPGHKRRQRDIPWMMPRRLSRGSGLRGPSPRTGLLPRRDRRQTQAELGKVATELGEEIRRSFDYYQAQEAAVPVGQLILSGRGALVRNLDSHLAELLGMPVALANPLAHIAENSSDVPDAESCVDGPLPLGCPGSRLAREELAWAPHQPCPTLRADRVPPRTSACC